jgi:uncharacterized protein YchJ
MSTAIPTRFDSFIDEFLASEKGKRFNEFRRDSQDILAAFVDAAARAPREMDEASADRALVSVVPRLKKARLEDAPALVRAFCEFAGVAAVGAFAEKRGKELAREDEDKRKPVVNKAAEQGRNDPCGCGSGKKFKKCCGAK